MRATLKSADEVSAALERANVELTTEMRLARVGLKERQELAPIIARYGDLFTEEQRRAVEAECENATGERRDELMRLYHALLEGAVEMRVAPYRDELVSSLATASAAVDGDSYPFHALVPAISRSADAARRERLLDGMVSVIAPRNALYDGLFAATEAALADLGYARYLDYVVALKGVDYARFAAVIAETLAATRPLYDAHVVPWVQSELGQPLDGSSCAHTYWLRRNPVPAELFPPGRMVGALRDTLRAMGIDLDGQTNIHIDAEDRPTKNPRACVIAARVPDEIHLIVKPAGGKADYDAFFHEAGHAEHYAGMEARLPYAFRRLPRSMALLELFSYLMENLVNDPGWLETHLDLSPRQAAFVGYRSALSDLMLLRRYCAKFLYEYTFYSAGGDGPALYAGNLSRDTGFVYPPEMWQYDRDPGLYAADYLRAWFGHAQVLAALRDRYGPRWWADPTAGRFVRDLWHAGVKPELEDVVRDLGATPWDVRALQQYYDERIAHGVASP